MSDLNVLMVATVDPTGTSGHNIATFEVISALVAEKNIKLSLICPRPKMNTSAAAAYLEANIKYLYYLDSKVYRSILYNIKLQFQIIPLFIKAIKNNKPHLIITRLGTCFTLPLLARFYKMPYYLLVRGLSGKDYKSRYSFPGLHYISNLLLLLNCRAARLVIVAFTEVVEEVKRFMRKDQTEPVIFTNAVNPKLYPPVGIEKAREETGLPINKDSFVVGFVGSVKKRHGLSLLLNSMDLVDRKVKDYHVVIVGKGPELENLQGIVKERGLIERVHFTGFIPHEKVYLYMAAANVLYGVLDPHEFENPIKCYEYLAAARPVITSERAEFKFITENNYGLTVESYSKESVASAIVNLYEAGEAKRTLMGTRGREYVMQNHTWKQLIYLIESDFNSYLSSLN